MIIVIDYVFEKGQLRGLALRKLYPFEALAEIFDFVAGLVKRVPKKTSIAKSDLQNSTASLLTTVERDNIELLNQGRQSP